MYNIIIDKLTLLAPELLLTVGALTLLLVGVFLNRYAFRIVGLISILLLSVIFILAVFFPTMGEGFRLINDLASPAFIRDEFTKFVSIFILLGAIFSLIFAFIDKRNNSNIYKFEYVILLLLATAGMLFTISAGNFLAIYLGLELQALALYAMVSFNRTSVQSSEAGLKYFILGSFSSGFLLYGISLLYGSTGSIGFDEISKVAGQSPDLLLVVGMVFIFAGLAFKISAVPFHMWSPDVYQGAPIAVTSFLGTSSKVSAVAILLKVSMVAFGALYNSWTMVIVFMAVISMLIGALAAIAQSDVKRIVAYSSIGNIGYVLVPVSLYTLQGTTATLLYLAIYSVTMIGFFAFLTSLKTSVRSRITLEDLKGYGRKYPWQAFAVSILLFSLAGIPPFAGFFAKWYSFSAAVSAGYWLLALVGVLTSVIAAFYYLRLIKVMFVDKATTECYSTSYLARVILFVVVLLVTIYILYGSYLHKLAQQAGQTFGY